MSAVDNKIYEIKLMLFFNQLIVTKKNYKKAYHCTKQSRFRNI